MADAVVSFALERLADLLVSEANNLHSFDHEINDMNLKLLQMQNFLKDADRKRSGNEGVRRWVSDMRQLAFRAEDVVDTFVMEVENKKPKSGFKEILRKFASIYGEWKLRNYFTMEIEAIKSDLSDLNASVQTLGITNSLQGESSSSQVNLKSRRRIPFSHELENDFFGREEEIHRIISQLMDESKGCEVISICGMGGIGKTALARQIYNQEIVRAHFSGYAWVAITQRFDTEHIFRRVLTELLPASRKEEVSRMDIAELVQELYIVQSEKNCLIVFDDIWSSEFWESFELAFPVGKTTRASKVLITTRNFEVVETDFVHRIQLLTAEESWQLLCKKSRLNEIQEERVFYEMEIIGKDMLKLCGGLPLAITLAGGILKHTTLERWERTKKDFFSHSARDRYFLNVLGVIELCYDSLPLHLKYCFLCFANYKEDEVVDTGELYMIWIAEGLISVEHKAEGEMLLDVAERYLNELANLSLVQVEDSMWSKPRTCRVHDLIQDFCFFKAKEEEFMSVIDLQDHFQYEIKASTVRRLCISSYSEGDESRLNHFNQHVISHMRSVFVQKPSSTAMGVWPGKILSLEKFKVLRVLTVKRYEFSIQNINNISELGCLKYLCLRHCKCKFKELPSSIGNLRNLGTLDLRVSSSIRIPNVLWKLKKLKHLYLPEFFEEGGSIVKLRFEGLDELELIYNYNTMYCDAQDLLLLPNLKLFDGGIILEDNLAENIIDFIKSKEFVSSVFEGEDGGKCLISILSKYDDNMIGSNHVTGETSQPALSP